MGLFENFPYTNFHELNASWLVKKMNELIEAMETFKATESLKFADPIIWDITTQYQKSTIVLDPTGNAYLSVQPVPAGVQLSDDEYWLEIFNFTNYTRTANKNLTAHVETNTTRATAAYNVDEWLIWEDVLYKVTAAISIDDALVVGTNLVHFTVEDFIKAWVIYANGLIQQYKNDIDASELAYRNQLALDISNTTASLQAQLDAAIAGATVDSEVINARIGADGVTYLTLGDAIRTQVDYTLDYLFYTEADDAGLADACVAYSTGTLFVNNTQSPHAVQYVPVVPKSEIVLTMTICLIAGSRGMAFYDENKVYISGTPLVVNQTVYTLTVPDNAYYFSFTYFGASYSLQPKNYTKLLEVVNKTVGLVSITDDDFTGEADHYIAYDNGLSYYNTSGSPYAVSNIPIIKGKKIHANISFIPVAGVRGFAFYDEHNQYISGIQLVMGQNNYDLTPPSDACYISLTYFDGGHFRLSYEDISYKDLMGLSYAMYQHCSNFNRSFFNPLAIIDRDYGYMRIFKNIGVVGDSLSAGEMAYKSLNDGLIYFKDMYYFSWIYYIARGCSTTPHAFAQGGLSTKNFINDVGGRKTDLLNSNNKCEAYFIALAHNDYSQGITIGTIADVGTTADTYYKYYSDIISLIRSIDTHVPIFCITAKSNTYSAYNAAVRDLVANMGVNNLYLIDMETYAPNIETWEFYRGHGDALGYLNYSYQIASYVNWIIKNNFSDFNMVQFLDSDLPVDWN